jgi:hypothetical protein
MNTVNNDEQEIHKLKCIIDEQKTIISDLQNKHKVVEKFLDLISTDCPIMLGEQFSACNPPFKPSCCEHNMSKLALSQLPMYIGYSDDGSVVNYMKCPVCNKKILFCSINWYFLLFITLKQAYEDGPGQRSEGIISYSIHTNTPLKLFSPTGGILTRCKKLINSS